MSIRKTLVESSEPQCPDCKDSNVVHDVAQGQMVCTGCGLVLGGRVISDESEWRTFSDSSPNAADPNRVGSKSHALLDSSMLSTEIGAGAGSYQLAKYQNRTAEESSQRALLAAFREVERYCDRLNLSQTVKSIAQEVFKQLHDASLLKGRPRPVVIVTCIYIACQAENVPRTIKELSEEFDLKHRDIGRYYGRLLRLKKDGKVKLTRKRRPQAGDQPRSAKFMIRFCSDLDLPPIITNAATDVCVAIHKQVLCGGRTPAVVAAAAIFLISQLADDPKLRRTIAEIAKVAHIATSTVKATYKELLQHAQSVVPKDFADEARMASIWTEGRDNSSSSAHAKRVAALASDD